MNTTITRQNTEIRSNRDGQTLIPGAPTDTDIETAKKDEDFLLFMKEMNLLNGKIDSLLERLTKSDKDNHRGVLCRVKAIEAFLTALDFLKTSSNDYGDIRYTSRNNKSCYSIKLTSSSIVNVKNDQEKQTQGFDRRYQEFLNLKTLR